MSADLQTMVFPVFMYAHKNVIIGSYSFRMFPSRHCIRHVLPNSYSLSYSLSPVLKAWTSPSINSE